MKNVIFRKYPFIFHTLKDTLLNPYLQMMITGNSLVVDLIYYERFSEVIRLTNLNYSWKLISIRAKIWYYSVQAAKSMANNRAGLDRFVTSYTVFISV